MNIFLVRHGQTLLNQSHTHQYSTTPLSEKGLLEAERIAQHLSEVEIDVIYSSPLMRAKQTAEIISHHSRKKVTFLDELREVKRPSEIEGKTQRDPKVKQIKNAIMKNYENKDWHHSDEENYWDIKQRVQSLITLIQNDPSENILLVSHGVVIKMFLSFCIFNDSLTPQIFLSMYNNIDIANTGISHCRYIENSEWKVVRVNDTTHLK